MPTASYRILIVDDDERNIRILQEILQDDYELEKATNGSQALAIVTEFAPDLILLDVMMPDMDGYQVARTIKSDNNLSGIKIILVSASASDMDKLEGKNAGADGYVTKPFLFDELENEIQKAINS